MECQLQLPFPLGSDVGLDVEAMREHLHMLPPTRLYRLLASPHREDKAELWALAVLGAEVIEQVTCESDRRRLLWVLAELNDHLDRLPQAIDAYHEAALGLEGRGNAFVLVCARARAFCLSRLGFHTEAAAEYARFRRAAAAYPFIVRAELEHDLGEWHDERGLGEQALENYTLATAHYRACGYERGAAHCDLDRGETLMFMGRPRQSARTMAHARHLLASLGETRDVTRADQGLEELFAYWGKPRRRLAAARRAYEGLMAQGKRFAAAYAQENCAQALAQLGRTEERDKAYTRALELLACAALERESTTKLMEEVMGGIRLDFAHHLAEDGRFREALTQAAAAVKELGTLEQG